MNILRAFLWLQGASFFFHISTKGAPASTFSAKKKRKLRVKEAQTCTLLCYCLFLLLLFFFVTVLQRDAEAGSRPHHCSGY